MSFQNIKLLECNRRESVEADTNEVNNAQWTNRMGDGVHLDVGDTIEVKNAFINQRGCANANSLEFKGRSLGVNGKFIATTPSKEYPEIISFNDINTHLNDDAANPYDPANNPINHNWQGGVVFRQLENVENEVELLDNEMNLEINFYKSNNGEQTLMLPRNFIGQNHETATTAPYYYIARDLWSSYDYDKDVVEDVVSLTRTYTRGNRSGINYYQLDTMDHFGFRQNNKMLVPMLNTNDYHQVVQRPYGATGPAPYGVAAPKYVRFVPRNNNQRFTLFEREYDWLYHNTDEDVSYTYEGVKITAVEWWKRTNLIGTAFPQRFLPPVDPYGLQINSALCGSYLKVSDTQKIVIEKGFSSPQSVAEQITEQLQAQTTDSPEIYQNTTWRDASYNHIGHNDLDFTTAYKTQTYKPVYCANTNDFNYINYANYLDNDWTNPVANVAQGSFQWWRSYHNIYVKRPDLFIAGRKINNWGGYVNSPTDPPTQDINKPVINTLYPGTKNYIQTAINFTADLLNNTTDSITTSWIYNKENLELLSELFIVQGKYPDLFKGYTDAFEDNQVYYNRKYDEDGTTIIWNTINTIDNSRFLHINRANEHIIAGTGSKGLYFEGLGSDDNFRYTYTDSGRAWDFPHMSAPQFFKYDKTYEGIMTSGLDITQLSYGFATKTKVAGKGDTYYIVIHPELVGGIRPEVFSNRLGETGGVMTPGNIDADTCIIGWDFHANSWGNVVMLQSTGIPYQSWDNNWFPGQDTTDGYDFPQDTIDMMSMTYIGANNPACIYDNVSGRFGWEYLHIPETIGNKFNSGSTKYIDTTETDIQDFPIIADAGQEVYKMNKRPHTWTWSPDIQIRDAEGSLEAGGTHADVNMNPMPNDLDAWTIYDTMMGINLNFGKTAEIDTRIIPRSQDEVWNSSVLGIMGFTYEQFNPETINALNDGNSAIISNDNIRSIYNPTTNCQIVNTDTNNFVMNPYGAVQSSTQLPYALRFTLTPKGGSPYDYAYLPAISQATQSIKILGINLPKVVLRPYLTIRTDLIADKVYVGGTNSGTSLPVIAVVNKINADKDFVQIDGADVFTITRPMHFSSITTQITDPGGDLALLDDSSAVIYKITKQDNLANYNILEDFVKGLKKK